MRSLLVTGFVLLFAVAPIAAQRPAPPPLPDSAAERKLLDEALGHIRDKKYPFAVARLAPLAGSRTLPAPVVKAVPGLIMDLRRLDALGQLAATSPDRPSPVVAVDLLPSTLRQPYARLELSRALSLLLTVPLPRGAESPWTVEQANALLDPVEAEFGTDDAQRLRVELSARLFLAGKPQDATRLIENETPNDYAREVLADLRTIIVGGGTLVNPQVARFLPESGLEGMPGAAALVPTSLRDRWQRPKPPTGSETTLAKLEQRARKETTGAAVPEFEKLARKVSTTTESIRAEMEKP